MGAMVALQALQNTQQQLAVTQKQISTGFRVADSTDDGAAYAIAQGIRSTVGALTSANQQMGNTQGLLQTTQSGLNNISNTMASMRDVLVKLSDSSVQNNDRSNYISQYNTMLSNVKTFIQDANYSGKSLINSYSNSTAGYAAISVARNETGGAYHITNIVGSAIYASAVFTSTAMASAGDMKAALTAHGIFINAQATVGKNLNSIGNSINYINHQITYNNNKIDALNSGLGSLIDADLAKESAQLTALQIRQQLGTQALSLANQAPQSLLSLFK